MAKLLGIMLIIFCLLSYTILLLLTADYYPTLFLTLLFAFLAYFFCSEFARRRKWNFPKSLKPGLIAITLLIFIPLQLLDIIGSRSLSKALAKANDHKMRLTSEQFNAEYKKLEKKQHNAGPMVMAAAQMLDAQVDVKMNHNEIPWFYGQWEHTEKIEPEQLKLIKELLDSTQQTTSIIEEALQYPQVMMPLEFPRGYKVWSMLLPHLNALRQCSRFFALKSYYYQQTGNPQQAIAAIHNIFRLGDMLKREPLLISYLVRIAIHKTGFQAMEYFLYSNCGDLQQLQNLQKFIEPLCTYQQHIVDTELAGAYALVDEELLAQPVWRRVQQTKNLASVNSILLMFFCKGWVKIDVAYLMDRHIEYIKLIQRGKEAEVAQHLQVPAGETFNMYSRPLSAMFLPNWKSIIEREFERLTLARCLWTALALKIAKLQGEKNLNPTELIAKQKMCTDPFSRKKLLYKKTANKSIIYGVGENYEDDGGIIQTVGKITKQDAGIVISE